MIRMIIVIVILTAIMILNMVLSMMFGRILFIRIIKKIVFE